MTSAQFEKVLAKHINNWKKSNEKDIPFEQSSHIQNYINDKVFEKK